MVHQNISEQLSVFHALRMRYSLLLFSVRNEVANISKTITHGAIILHKMIISKEKAYVTGEKESYWETIKTIGLEDNQNIKRNTEEVFPIQFILPGLLSMIK